MSTCRVCAGGVTEFFDFGRQPLANAFLLPEEVDREFFFRLAVGMCEACTTVQLMEEVPRELMFRAEYPYYSSGSAVMRAHFEQTARDLLAGPASGPDPFVVELGCNDGVMLRVLAEAGRRHLGVEPSGQVGRVAAERGVRVRNDFFDETVAAEIRAADGPADVIFAANTLCHIPYLDSILRGVAGLLGPGGEFQFEDPYFSDILAGTAFDQIYDEHFYYFTARSVTAIANRYGLELVDVRRLPVHGGEIRYTLTHAGARKPSTAVADLLLEEGELGVAEPAALEGFAGRIRRNRDDLVALLTRLRAEGKRVVGYGATSKSSTVTNYCGIGPDLVEFVCDTTPAKQGRLSPGAHIPVLPHHAFAQRYPDYALLFAWNHATEIIANETGFTAAGGAWIRYVPDVHMVDLSKTVTF